MRFAEDCAKESEVEEIQGADKEVISEASYTLTTSIERIAGCHPNVINALDFNQIDPSPISHTVLGERPLIPVRQISSIFAHFISFPVSNLLSRFGSADAYISSSYATRLN